MAPSSATVSWRASQVALQKALCNSQAEEGIGICLARHRTQLQPQLPGALASCSTTAGVSPRLKCFAKNSAKLTRFAEERARSSHCRKLRVLTSRKASCKRGVGVCWPDYTYFKHVAGASACRAR